MATTVLSFPPAAAELPTSNAPQYAIQNGELVLAFDATTEETAIFKDIMPQAFAGGTLSAELWVRMASATSGATVWLASVEAIADAETGNSDSFDSANTSGAVTVPASANTIDVISITLTTADSVAAGEKVRIKIARDADAAGDTATGDAYLYHVEIRES